MQLVLHRAFKNCDFYRLLPCRFGLFAAINGNEQDTGQHQQAAHGHTHGDRVAEPDGAERHADDGLQHGDERRGGSTQQADAIHHQEIAAYREQAAGQYIQPAGGLGRRCQGTRQRGQDAKQHRAGQRDVEELGLNGQVVGGAFLVGDEVAAIGKGGDQRTDDAQGVHITALAGQEDHARNGTDDGAQLQLGKALLEDRAHDDTDHRGIQEVEHDGHANRQVQVGGVQQHRSDEHTHRTHQHRLDKLDGGGFQAALFQQSHAQADQRDDAIRVNHQAVHGQAVQQDLFLERGHDAHASCGGRHGEESNNH